MRVLLDTHVLVWALTSPERLSATARELLEDATTELVVSAVTPWELATKHRIGKLEQAAPLLTAFDESLARLGAQELAITGRHALTAGSMNWDHRDPFDRALAAQALIEQLPLLSGDRAFDSLAGVRVVW